MRRPSGSPCCPRATSPTASRSPPTATCGSRRSCGGTVDILAPDGTFRDSLETGGAPLNCVFDDGDLIITDFGDRTEVPADAPMDGRLWRVAVGVEGMPLFRGSIG